MIDLKFMNIKGEEFALQCNPKDKMLEVFFNFSKKFNKIYKQLIFFSNGLRIDNDIILEDFIKNNPNKDVVVFIIEMDIEVQSKEEKKIKEIKNEIIDIIKNPRKNINYDKFQELAAQYSYCTEKIIEEEKLIHPEKFIDIKEASNGKDQQLFILGKLGESLENMGIKVAIVKKDIKDKKDIKTDDYIINNEFISSGILYKNKYEINLIENDKNKIYLILNKEDEQNNFIDEWKEYISNYIEIPKNEIVIINLRAPLTMDVFFKKIEYKNKKDIVINISEGMKEFANSNPKILNIYNKNILDNIK